MKIKSQLKDIGGYAETARRADLAKIHVLAKNLGLDRDLYRDVVRMVTGADSAADLDAAGRRKLIAHFKARAGSRPTHHAGAPRTIDQRPMLRKIEALLADAKRPWAYAEAVAQRICRRERLEFCSDGDLRAVIAALATDAKRHPRGANA